MQTEEIIFNVKPEVRTAWIWAIPTLGLSLLSSYISRWTTSYELTNERLKISEGFIARREDDVELYRIKDTKFSQTIMERLFGIGTVVVQGSDMTGTVVMTKIANPKQVRETLRNTVNKSRTANNVRIHTN